MREGGLDLAIWSGIAVLTTSRKWFENKETYVAGKGIKVFRWLTTDANISWLPYLVLKNTFCVQTKVNGVYRRLRVCNPYKKGSWHEILRKEFHNLDWKSTAPYREQLRQLASWEKPGWLSLRQLQKWSHTMLSKNFKYWKHKNYLQK